MRKMIFIGLVVLIMANFQSLAQSGKKMQKKTEPTEAAFQLKTMLDTISYIIGTDVAFTLKKNEMELNAASFSKGFTDAWQGIDTIFTTSESETIMVKFGAELQAKRELENAQKNAGAIAAGKEFLENNKTKEGVFTTESGLQYQIIKQGDGEKPPANSNVTVHYKGMLLNGTVFDSSYERGTPNTFELARLIPGWNEGIQLMPTGSTYKFFIPSELGYGSREAGDIPANAILIFDVELLGFE